MSELQFKGWLENELKGTWVDTISPGSGSTFGYPDIGMLVPGTAIYMPVELKHAEVKFTPSKHVKRLVADGWEHTIIPEEKKIRPSRLRPTQIAWHDGFTRAGGYSRIVLANMQPEGLLVWVIDQPEQAHLKKWKDGFRPDELLLVAEESKLDLDAWWRGPLHWWDSLANRVSAA